MGRGRAPVPEPPSSNTATTQGSSGGFAESVRRSGLVKRRSANKFFLTFSLFALIVLAAMPFGGWILWAVEPAVDLDLLVYDSTVFTEARKQHNAVGLIMTYLKVPFDGDADYVGSSPGGLAFGMWPQEQPDLVLLVDAYGVYVNEQADIDENGEIRVSRSFPESFARDVASWADSGAVVMGEFNMMHEPTDAVTSEVLQSVFGVNPTGWTGRAFEDLQDASPRLRELHDRDWDYEGPGVILVRASVGDQTRDSQLVVLLPEHLEELAPVVSGDLMHRDREINLSYSFWFALIETDPGADTQLWIDLPVNDRGAAVLEELGIALRYPFLVWNDNTVYAAGNVASTPAAFPARRILGALPVLERFPADDNAAMFYRVYAPLVEQLVEMAKISD